MSSHLCGSQWMGNVGGTSRLGAGVILTAKGGNLGYLFLYQELAQGRQPKELFAIPAQAFLPGKVRTNLRMGIEMS